LGRVAARFTAAAAFDGIVTAKGTLLYQGSGWTSAVLASAQQPDISWLANTGKQFVG